LDLRRERSTSLPRRSSSMRESMAAVTDGFTSSYTSALKWRRPARARVGREWCFT
jgi:hypothetical protein